MAQLSLYDLNRLKLDATKAAADALRIDAATINNGLTVKSSVPANAKFTDTVYTHPTTHPVTMITGLHTVATSGSYTDLINKPANLPANGGNSDTVDSCHVNDAKTDNTSLWTSTKIQSKLNEKENTIVFSGTTKPTKDCIWIDTATSVFTSTNAKFVDIKGSTGRTWHFETNDTQVKTQNNTSNLKNDITEINRLIGTKADNTLVTQTKHGIMSKEDKAKLDGIASQANNYVHPVTHSASMITGLPTSLPANGGNSDTVGGKSVNDNQAGTAYLWTAGKIQSLLDGKSNNGHTHDDRYYTEAEIDTKLTTKSDTTHTHSNYIPTSASCNKNWNWAFGSAAPTHLWGSQGSATDFYVYAPSQLHVGSANVAYNLSCNNYGAPIEVGQYIDFHQVGTNNDYSVRLTGASDALTCSGTFSATKVYNAIYNDYAEWFERQDLNEQLEPGDLICIGEDDRYTKSTSSYQTDVIGVYSDSYGHIVGGEQLENMADNIQKFIPIGLSGRVKVKLIGKIKKGDLIVSSDIPGVTKKMIDFRPGTIIGKAVEDKNTDEIQRVKMLIFNS